MSATPGSTLTDAKDNLIADLQRQLAERDAELAEARMQQAASAEVLQVINSSPGDLQPVFDAILQKAHALCGSSLGALFLRDGERFLPAAMRDPELMAAALRQDGMGSDAPVVRPLLSGDSVVHIIDLTLVDHPLARAAVAEGVRTLLSIPLRKGDTLLGMINAARLEVHPFSEKQIALLQNFAAQAVIAMENARLITETREALEQQTATAEVLGVINASPGELKPVFEAMLDRAMTLCGAAFGAFMSYDGNKVYAVATRGLPPDLVDVFREPVAPRRDGDGPYARFLRGEPLQHIVDMAADNVFPSLASRPRALAEIGGARTGLEIPLRKEGVLLGSIWLYRREVRPFSEKQIALLQNFAAQAVIAMENARLLTETREALEQQTATAEVLGVINASPGDLGPVFDAMLEKAMRLCEASLGTLDRFDGEVFQSVALRGVSGAAAELYWVAVVPDPGSASERLVRGEDVVHIPDVVDTEAYRSGVPSRRRLVEETGARTALWVALRKEAKLLGRFVIYRKEVRPFTDKQIALVQNFAAQAVIAIENARLLGELRQRTEEVDELNRGLEARVAAQVDELGRVGRLKRFLAPQLAELIVSQGDEKILESHRREIVVVFCDLRGYTAFTETAEPEEVLDFLREYHGALGPLVAQFEGTLDQFSGDGIMVFFNDPVPILDPAERAVKMAVAMRDAAGVLIALWRRRDRELGFGVGIAQGYATLEQIGFAERSGYTAIGTVCNLAARLCAEAKDGQILISGRVAAAIEKVLPLKDLGSLALKGLSQPISAFNVPLAANQPALRVIEGRPPNV
jgi:adenylate cyclase